MASPSTPDRLIAPATLAALGSLELIARVVVDGFMYGVHPSRAVGAGIEFSQYRSYQPGDDLRRVDWKLFGRSDRYFVRESEAETSVTVQLILDATGSMAESDAGLEKLDYGRFLCAALALLAHRQGDAIALHVVADGAAASVRAARGQRHHHRVLHALESATASGDWPDWDVIEAPMTSGGRAVTIFVGDLHEREAEVRTAIRHLAALRHDVAVIHLIGRREVDLACSGSVTFEEIETGRRIEFDADAARPAYLHAVGAALEAVAAELAERRVVYVRGITDQPLDGLLRAFAAVRART